MVNAIFKLKLVAHARSNQYGTKTQTLAGQMSIEMYGNFWAELNFTNVSKVGSNNNDYYDWHWNKLSIN